MGGRGSKSGFSWKKQLKALADEGKMPAFIGGSREQQAQVLEEIDKLYPMPDTTGVQIIQGSTDVRVVQSNGRTSRGGYPSGAAASEAEKRGALKFLLNSIRIRNNG